MKMISLNNNDIEGSNEDNVFSLSSYVILSYFAFDSWCL